MRSYKIKIVLKELPTYGVLYQRKVNEIVDAVCPRCNNEIDWYHVWKMNRIWELLRGVYNRKFDEISKKKEYKNVIEHLWSFCYDKYRTRIWVKRCDEVAEIEKDRGIDLKKEKKNRGGR
ncbi:hypothetical protein RhiirA5_422608 [Rhizophagus irregularis]|uniref:Uncharacterized protein n=1 Tax=Rhizophagus irregularis TaxID=588596 RepID=A0A2N0PBJ3_9GLOM|nr:hypothetical protein RhiirA5_422608 [Rhizophagus irregularis]